MPPPVAKPDAPVALVCGEDDFAVKQRAKQLYQQWCDALGGMDHEMIEATVSNSGEALKAIGRLRESLQTLPFFGSGKAIWLRDCNFLGDERAAQAGAVTETLAELAQELKTFAWDKVRLLVSAGKVDKRKTFYKVLEKIGRVESFEGWSVNDKDWGDQAEAWARKGIQARAKQIGERALGELITCVGPHPRQLDSEIEKLCLYVGERMEIGAADVKAVCVKNKTSRAFALGDALGNRDLPGLLCCLDEELWAMQFDKEKSEIGMLYGLISKVRSLLMLKEMLREGWIKPTENYSQFKMQLERVPAAQLPTDKKYNPLALNPYVLFKALPQARHYSEAELVRAMDLLLRANQRLVASALDEKLVLQQTLVQIVGTATARSTAARRTA
ncbi:MAG: DNA polymerase III subunit delta [Verrucomicrobia subdivision 3 bacterium]|nr:DNA polymerase III subunit delta [Limisphaerales bacterium]